MACCQRCLRDEEWGIQPTKMVIYHQQQDLTSKNHDLAIKHGDLSNNNWDLTNKNEGFSYQKIRILPSKIWW